MVGKLVSVKTYDLAGDDIRISFSMEDPNKLELVYEDKQGPRQFSGRAITWQKAELGFMASVILEQAPDLRVVILSLAVPSANRSSDAKSIPVKTFAVQTTQRTSIGGPNLVDGQIQTHEVHMLEGNAW